MTNQRDGLTFADALKRDVLEGRRAEGLNPGDKKRWLAEQEEEKQERKAELERMVDAAIAKARAESEAKQ